MAQLERFISTLTLALLAAVLLMLAPSQSRAAEGNESGAGHLSAFEEYALRKNAGIRQFGYELFREPPTTFAPADAVPVGPDYVLGPGDELRVSIWGKVNAEQAVMIDRDGSVHIPQIGVLQLSGLSFEEGRVFLERELGRYYKPSEVKMNLSMGRLRSLRVFVVGKAARPGAYTISALSTLINALFAAGGPSKVGTMRDIQLKRRGQTVVSLDLYDFLLRGDKSRDARLMPEDVIFIPAIGPLAGISGHVKTPAIYEMKDEKTAADLIDMAGGLDDIAFTGRVQIERIAENNREVVVEASLNETAPEDMGVEPGDIFKIFSVVADRKVVRLAGAVHRDGEYGMTPGMTVKDLVSLAGGLKYYAYTGQAELTRVYPTEDGPRTETISFDLSRALSGDPAHDVGLSENDYVFVRAVPEWDLYKTIRLSGEFRFPGTYTIKKGETISSLIERAGGFTEKAYLKGAVFARESVRALQQRQLDEAIDRLEHEILSTSAGAIEAALSPEESASQQAALAQRRALIAKMRAAKARGRVAIRLSALDEFRGSPSDLALEEGDSLAVPETPSQVQVMGAVYNQTAFVFSPRDGISGYLRKAGGLTRNADEDELYVLKVDGTAMRGGAWGFTSAGLDPGDTIVVPEDIEKTAWLREVKDLTQILYQIAVTAGVLIVAF
jgi:protein involved in polysaccharide export with SLBB domain